jgi:hypothetical protein
MLYTFSKGRKAFSKDTLLHHHLVQWIRPCPIRASACIGVFAVEHIIQYQRQPSCSAGSMYGPSHQVVAHGIRVGIRTDIQASATIGAEDIPVSEARISIDLPGAHSIVQLSRIEGYGVTRTILRALFAPGAELERRPLSKHTIRQKRHAGCDDAKPNTWTTTGCHEQSHSPNRPKSGIPSH